MSYAHDVVTLRHRKIDDGSLRFSRRAASNRTRGPDGADAVRGASAAAPHGIDQ